MAKDQRTAYSRPWIAYGWLARALKGAPVGSESKGIEGKMNIKTVHAGMIEIVRDGIVTAGKEGGGTVQAKANMKGKKLVPLVTFFCAIVALVAISTSATAVQYTYQRDTGGLLIQTDTTVTGDWNGMSRIGWLHRAVSNMGGVPVVYSCRTDVGVLPTLFYSHNGQVTTDQPTDMQEAGRRHAIWEGPRNNPATSASSTPFSLGNHGSSTGSGNTCPITVPEASSSLALFGISLAGLGFAGRKFRSL